VIGAGGVGVNAIQGARLRGAAEIHVFDISPDRLEQARRFGATSGVDVRDEDRLEALRRSAPRSGYDWTIVTVGRADAVQLGVELIRPGGTTVVVGLLPESTPVALDMLDLVTFEKRVVGSAYGTTSPQILMPRILRLYQEGKLVLDELVSDRLPLEEIDEAFARSRRADGLRPVLAITDGGSFC
jgi:Zn-dependent alcohol dehydrogenase